jgi:hypothetical protein
VNEIKKKKKILRRTTKTFVYLVLILLVILVLLAYFREESYSLPRLPKYINIDDPDPTCQILSEDFLKPVTVDHLIFYITKNPLLIGFLDNVKNLGQLKFLHLLLLRRQAIDSIYESFYFFPLIFFIFFPFDGLTLLFFTLLQLYLHGHGIPVPSEDVDTIKLLLESILQRDISLSLRQICELELRLLDKK